MTAQTETLDKPPPVFHRISVIVPANPFTPTPLSRVRHCLAALNVVKLMDWWPGKPHFPHRDPKKVRAIQRSLDWKRVAQIAAYLLQREIVGAPKKIEQYFSDIYGDLAGDPGREWPPHVPTVASGSQLSHLCFTYKCQSNLGVGHGLLLKPLLRSRVGSLARNFSII
jgi:hypothetical protein